MFGPEFAEAHAALLKLVGEEKERGVQNSFHMQLWKAIDRVTERLSIQPDYGIHIPKNLIPKAFIEKYDINNLWKVDLPDGWRLLYTLNTGQLEILTVLLDFMDHSRYDKLFGYRKKR